METLESSGGVPRAQALLTTHPQYDDLTPTQYSSALTWMRELGLLDDLQSPLPPAKRVLSAIFERGSLPWVRDADELVRSPEELPSDIAAVGEALGLNTGEVYDQLVASWGKVDTAARERVGAAGEAVLVALLRDATDGKIDHVSTWSDGYGYDVTFTAGSTRLHLEVKSTTRAGRLTIFLSRHEYEVMLRDPCWVLVTVRLSTGLEILGLGSIRREWVAANVPGDCTQFGSWASVKLELPTNAVVSGVPALSEHLTGPLPGW
ncbi:DUF3883 domain-containing protein [Ornithinimicrobium sp. W1679]|uniref:DUF3883 domain-containing protein n=1 Tax=Ornithinimicrobium sp. W1679 TaxID=3418770 RepID=UPI003CF8DFDF